MHCHCKGMENNNSPYVYEKPLRTSNKKRGRGIAALGLVALGAVVGSGAFAQVLEADAATENQSSADSVVVTATDSAQPDAIEVVDANQVTNATVSDISSPIVAVPFEQTKPKKNSAAIELPALSSNAFGNTSSATPSAGGAQTGSNLGTYKTRESDDGENSYEDRHESRENDDDNEEYED